MRVIALDLETHLTSPGMLAPRVVCYSWATRDASFGLPMTDAFEEVYGTLELREDGLKRLRRYLEDPSVLLVSHSMPYDLGCSCAEDSELVALVFAAYRAGRITCTISRQKIIDVALGMRVWRRARGKVLPAKYSLADLVLLYFDRHLEKLDTWRLRYALLDGVPLEQWPPDAKSYAANDAVEHLLVYEAQARTMRDLWGGDLPNLTETAQAAWSLHLMSMYGIRAEEEAVTYFEETCATEINKMYVALADTGILKPPDAEGKRGRIMSEISRRIEASLTELGIEIPKTPTGRTGTDKETLEKTDDPALHVLAESMTFAKHLSQWGPVLRAAVQRPVCCRYDELRETGRTSSSGSEGQEGSNIQNPPRKGDVRPAIVPRPGWVFVSTDADTIELRAHAQNCLELVGWSKMAEALVEQHETNGPDAHLRLAANILNLDVYKALERFRDGDAEVEAARQFAKIPGFGYPGGLGPKSFIAYAAGQMDKEVHQKWFGTNFRDQLRFAQHIKAVWLETNPENKPYFKICGDMIDEARGTGTIKQLMSGRVRGDVRFCAIANGFFQGRVADAMKEALFNLATECYAGTCTEISGSGMHADGKFYQCEACGGTGRSVLHGSRPVMFLHDEPIVEHPYDSTLTARAERQRQIVVAALTRWMPSIPCTSTAVASLRWHKGAKPLYVDGLLVPVKPNYFLNGVLVPHLPTKLAKNDVVKTKWVQDAA